MLSIANGQTYNVDHNVYDAKGMRLNNLVQGSCYDICVKESQTRKLDQGVSDSKAVSRSLRLKSCVKESQTQKLCQGVSDSKAVSRSLRLKSCVKESQTQKLCQGFSDSKDVSRSLRLKSKLFHRRGRRTIQPL